VESTRDFKGWLRSWLNGRCWNERLFRNTECNGEQRGCHLIPAPVVLSCVAQRGPNSCKTSRCRLQGGTYTARLDAANLAKKQSTLVRRVGIVVCVSDPCLELLAKLCAAKAHSQIDLKHETWQADRKSVVEVDVAAGGWCPVSTKTDWPDGGGRASSLQRGARSSDEKTVGRTPWSKQ